MRHRYEAEMTIKGRAVVYARNEKEAQTMMANGKAMYAGNKMKDISRTQHGPIRRADEVK